MQKSSRTFNYLFFLSLLVDFIISIGIKDEIKIARTFNQISAVFRGKHNSNKH